MKVKDIYKENLDRKYHNIVDTKGKEVQIQSDPIKSIKEHKYPVLIGTLLIVLILLLTFYKTLNTFFMVLVFFLILIGLSIYFNNYTIKSKKDSLFLKWNFQKFEIPYTYLKSVFLSRDFNALDIIPMVTYNIVIRYKDNMNIIRELIFPVTLIKAEELQAFLNNFVIEEEKSEDCVKFERLKKFKTIMKLCAFIIFVILICILIYYNLK